MKFLCIAAAVLMSLAGDSRAELIFTNNLRAICVRVPLYTPALMGILQKRIPQHDFAQSSQA